MITNLARRIGHAAVHRPSRLGWAIGAIAAALLAFALCDLTARTIDGWSARWTGQASMVVYLHEGVTDERALALAGDLRELGGVRRVDYVPPAEAAARLRGSLGDHGDLLDGVDDAALPGSLEVELDPGVREVAGASSIVDRLRGSDGVDDVELVGDDALAIGGVLAALRAAAWTLLALLGALSTWVVFATARLRVAGIKEEAEVAELLGATPGFTRWPHVIAGALHGAAGGVVAIAGVYVLHRAVAGKIAAALTGVLGKADVGFLPATQIAMVIGMGAVLGLVGTALATGRRALA